MRLFAAMMIGGVVLLVALPGVVAQGSAPGLGTLDNGCCQVEVQSWSRAKEPNCKIRGGLERC